MPYVIRDFIRSINSLIRLIAAVIRSMFVSECSLSLFCFPCFPNSTPPLYNYIIKDLNSIADALGAEFICSFKFPDGTEI